MNLFFLIFACAFIILILILTKPNNPVSNLLTDMLSPKRKLEKAVLECLGFANWNILPPFDDEIIVKSRQALNNYDYIKYFKEDRTKVDIALIKIAEKQDVIKIIDSFLNNNEFKAHKYYPEIKSKLLKLRNIAVSYVISVSYISSAGNLLDTRNIYVSPSRLNDLNNNPTILMTKSEQNKLLKEQKNEALNKRKRECYDNISDIVDVVNNEKEFLLSKDAATKMDSLVTSLLDNDFLGRIQKMKNSDSEDWRIIDKFIFDVKDGVDNIVLANKRLLNYYNSSNFSMLKQSCDSLIASQREFNLYIDEKARSISALFGTRIVRNETSTNDQFEYIRPYKKTITPFTAEVSSTVFSSAENNPLEYVVKYFYPNKDCYPEQIANLQQLLGELETLKEAKRIIEDNKAEYDQYLSEVPHFVLEQDEDGFYSRLGFATISESILVTEYKFSYTSEGGMAQRSFTIPMTEDTIIELIKILESKLTSSSFVKEQRQLMTKKLRQKIKERDNFTCCYCHNSTYKEPNLLLEIDHIVPVAKGGLTEESNLQTLCWKCNRSKSSKLIEN